MENKVSERALIQRINRRIAPEDLRLRKARPEDDAWLGHYYLVDATSSGVTGCWIDLEKYGREVGALCEYETLAW